MMRLSFGLKLLLFATLIGCNKEKPADRDLETATSGNFELVADEALRPAIDSLVIGFTKENPRAKVSVLYTSAGEAVQKILDQSARLVIVSRFLSPVERDLLAQHKITLPEFDIAEDAVACIVHPSNSLTAISMKDLRQIVRNEITDWSALEKSQTSGKLPGGSIVRVLGPYASSTEYLLDTLFLPPNTLQQGKIERYRTTDSVLARVRSEPNAIGFINSSWKHWMDSRHDSSVKVVSVIPYDSTGVTRPIMHHLAYIYQGLYPLCSRVNGYSFESPNSLPRGFLAYAMTPHGQTVFKNFDVLPRTQIIKLVPGK